MNINITESKMILSGGLISIRVAASPFSFSVKEITLFLLIEINTHTVEIENSQCRGRN